MAARSIKHSVCAPAAAAAHRFCRRRANNCMKTSSSDSWWPGGSSGSRPNLWGVHNRDKKLKLHPQRNAGCCSQSTEAGQQQCTTCGVSAECRPVTMCSGGRRLQVCNVQQRLGMQRASNGGHSTKVQRALQACPHRKGQSLQSEARWAGIWATVGRRSEKRGRACSGPVAVRARKRRETTRGELLGAPTCTSVSSSARITAPGS